MKKLILALASVLPAIAQTHYTIDPVHSSAQFSVKHLMISNVRGEFQKVTGTVVFDPKNISASKIEAVIDVASLSTHEEKRDTHLKSPAFFDLAKYPTITFESTGVKKQGGKYQVRGNLTIHGVTKPVVLTVEGPAREIKDQAGLLRTGASATTTINRRDFELTYSKMTDNVAVVGDQVNITLDLEMTRKPSDSASATK